MSEHHPMSITEAIYARRPVREFTLTPVSEATVHALLYAAVQASESVDADPWSFVIIQNPTVLDALLGPDNHSHAGTMIIVYGKTPAAFAAAQNIMLSAIGMGLGGAIFEPALGALNTSEWKTRLDVPAALTAIAPILIGYPSVSADDVRHRPPDIVCWIP